MKRSIELSKTETKLGRTCSTSLSSASIN